MSRELVESILAGDFVCANELFEEQLNILREQKLYEEKRRMAAKEKPFVQNTKADWVKYRKQNPSVKWNENKEGKKVAEKPKATPLGKGGKLSASDIKARRKAGYLKAGEAIPAMNFIKGVQAHLRSKIKDKKELSEMVDFSKSGWEQQKAETERLRQHAASNIPSDKEEQPRIMKINTTKKKSSAVGSGKMGALRSVIRQQRDQQASDWAEKRYQKHVDRKTMRSLGNIVKGQNIKANLKNLVKYGSKSSAVKVGKKAYAGWGNVVRTGMSGALEE